MFITGFFKVNVFSKVLLWSGLPQTYHLRPILKYQKLKTPNE